MLYRQKQSINREVTQMGIEILYQDFLRNKQMIDRLLLYNKAIRNCQQRPISINVIMAEKLIQIHPKRRSMKLEQCFKEVLAGLPDGVVICDYDVMFNPDYKVDVLNILTNARRHKEYSAVWPGVEKNGKLIYSEEDYPDYKTYEIENYDVICVMNG